MANEDNEATQQALIKQLENPDLSMLEIEKIEKKLDVLKAQER